MSVGQLEDYIILIQDNSWSANPRAELFFLNNVYTAYLQLSCTLLLQPQNQGVLSFTKAKSYSLFMLDVINFGKSVGGLNSQLSGNQI